MLSHMSSKQGVLSTCTLLGRGHTEAVESFGAHLFLALSTTHLGKKMGDGGQSPCTPAALQNSFLICCMGLFTELGF